MSFDKKTLSQAVDTSLHAPQKDMSIKCLSLASTTPQSLQKQSSNYKAEFFKVAT
jgi:hypothetical protein